MSETVTKTKTKSKTKDKASATTPAQGGVEKKKKKHRAKALGTGKIRNVNFIKNWPVMDGNYRISDAGKDYLVKFLFQDLATNTSIAQNEALKSDHKRISGPMMSAFFRMRLSRSDRAQYDEFATKMRVLREKINKEE
jgi:hypothetical protein